MPWYGNASLGLVSTTAARRVDWVTDTIKVALVTSTYTPNQDTHDFFDDITNELATATGYTAGGVTLGTKSTVYDSASNTTRMIAASASWTFSASKTMRYAIIYKDTGVAGTSPLLGYVDFGSDQTTSGVFTINWDATDGTLRMVVS
jgi:hypothetical protein